MTEITSSLQMGNIASKKLKWLFITLTFLATATAMYGFVFPLILPEILSDGFHDRYAFLSKPLMFGHIIGGAIALLISPIQFWIIKRYRTLHRYLGRVYVLAVLVSSIGGYYMAWNAFGGLISTIGLGILATLWWGFTLLALYFVMTGNIQQHKTWMLRSVALTFAAVTLRLYMPLLNIVFDEVLAQQIVYWVSWAGNLLVVEIWIKRQNMRFTHPYAQNN